MKTDKIMKRASEASTGLAVAVAFLNTALLVVKLVQAVTEAGQKSLADESSADDHRIEEND